MGEKYVGKESLGEESVQEEFLGEESLDEKYYIWVKSMCKKSF